MLFCLIRTIKIMKEHSGDDKSNPRLEKEKSQNHKSNLRLENYFPDLVKTA